mgnify:CR=1 FL=1
MASHKPIGIVFILLGIIIFILSLSADFIGFGEGTAIGYKQISGVIVGAIAIIAGVYLKRKN